MSAKIEILNPPETLPRGQTTPLQIKVIINKPVRVRGIRANFHGAEKADAQYTVTVRDSKGRSRTETRTATSYRDYVKEDYHLAGDEKLGCFAGLMDSILSVFGGGSGERMEPGEYLFDVGVTIPNDAPGSFKATNSSVFYKLTANIDVPLRVDPSLSHNFTVERSLEHLDTQPVHVRYPDEKGRGFFDKTFGKNVALQLALERNVLRAGEPVNGLLTIETEGPVTVNRFKYRLIAEERTQAQGHTDSAAHSHVLDTVDAPGIISVEHLERFSFTPPPDGPFTSKGSHHSIEWFLEVQLDVPWAKDPTIRVPITYLP